MTVDSERTRLRARSIRQRGGSSHIGGAGPVFCCGGEGLDAAEHEGDYIRIRCPRHGEPIKLPYYVHDHPIVVPVIHPRTHGANCRLIAIVSPNRTAVVKILPPGIRFEDAIGHFMLGQYLRPKGNG